MYRCKIPTCDPEPIIEYEPNWLSHAVPYRFENPSKCLRFEHLSITQSDHCENPNNFNASKSIKCDEGLIYKSDELTIVNAVSCSKKNPFSFISI